MGFLASLRLPYRSDTLFGLLFFLAFAVPVSFDLYTPEQFETPKLFLAYAGAAGLLLVAATRARKGGGWPVRLPAATFWYAALALFVLWPVLALPWSFDPLASLLGTYPRFTNGVTFSVAFSVLLISLLSLGQEKLRVILEVVLVAGFLISAYGVLQACGIGYYEGLPQQLLLRPPSLVGNPNFAAQFVVSLLPLSLYRVATVGGKRRWWYGLCAVANAAFLVAASSRGSLVGLVLAAACAGFLLLRQRAKVPALLTLGSLLVAAGLLTVFAAASRSAGPAGFAVSDDNVKTRLSVWRLTASAVAGHPLVGAGLGNYLTLYDRSKPASFGLERYSFDDAHNLLLHMAATGGLPAAVGLLLVVLIPLWLGLRSSDGEAGVLAAGLAAWFAASSFTPVSIACFVVLAVLLAAVLTKTRGVADLRLTRAVSVPAVLLSVCFLVLSVTFFAAEHFRAFGRQAFGAGRVDSAYRFARASVALEPYNLENYALLGAAVALSPGRAHELPAVAGRILKLHPGSGRSAVLAARAYAWRYFQDGRVEDLDSAGRLLEQAELLMPQVGLVPYLRAEQTVLLGDHGAAERFLERALALRPGYRDAWMLLASVKQRAGDRAGVVFALKQAQRLGPEDRALRHLIKLAAGTVPLSEIPLNVTLRLSEL